MTNRSQRDQALNHVQAIKAAATALRDEYAAPDRDPAQIADLHAAINRGLKLAEVHAVLAVADAIEKTSRPVTVGGEYL